ncbi:hypothetical protein ACSNOK_27825 [Streptomyces sp. URMC 126]
MATRAAPPREAREHGRLPTPPTQGTGFGDYLHSDGCHTDHITQ